VEEILHLTLAANLLNAVGGSPVLDAPHLLPPYPTTLPHGDRSFEISLVPFGPEAIELFLAIERPSAPNASPEGEDYETIGQFYEAIELGLGELCNALGEENVFVGDPARQITAGFGYTGSGRLIPVYDLPSALDALAEIIEQGEGTADHDVWDGDQQMFDPERDEVAHYFRFLELKLGRRYRRGDTPESGPTGDVVNVDWAGVRPMRRNPSTKQHPSRSAIRLAQEEFNHTYSTLLHLLEHAFNGNPRLLPVATGQMFTLKAQAQALMQLPTEDGTTVAGPSFEYVKPSDRHWTTGQDRRVTVLHNGPYVVHGEIPLRRKRKVASEDGNSVTWQLDGTIKTEEVYALCRCGQPSSKPFCDGSHADRVRRHRDRRSAAVP
jgi:CDGSH-type Zn-finger protein